MTTRALVSGELYQGLVRRTRKSDGGRFGVCKIRDRDRLEVRIWTAFVDNIELIEKFEKMRLGEPVAVSGPFFIGESGEYRISVFAMINASEKRKAKRATQTRAEEKVHSDEFEQAPRGDEEGPNDAIPF